MTAQDKYQRPKKEEYAAALRALHTCLETQKDTTRRTIRLCSESPRAKQPGTFAHDVVTAAEAEFAQAGNRFMR